jgi:hypothetical protein
MLAIQNARTAMLAATKAKKQECCVLEPPRGRTPDVPKPENLEC